MWILNLLLGQIKMIVFDLETNMSSKKLEGSDLDIQIKNYRVGAIKVDDDFNEVGRLQVLCSPGFALDPYIIKLTKITDVTLEDKKTF